MSSESRESPDDLRLAAALARTIDAARRQDPDFTPETQEHAELRQLAALAAMADVLADGGADDEAGADDGVGPAGDSGIAETQLYPDGPNVPSHPHAFPYEFGDYILLSELGRGGMGIVYQARQKSLERTVALKMILRGEFARHDEVARFRAEAEAAAQLNHPHIVQVYEVGEHADRPFFSMRLVEGTTLAKRLADGPLPPRETAELLVPVCRAVAEAHRNGILHRDLKPSNILIDRQGRPYVGDFGLAKRLPSLPSAVECSRVADESLTVSGAILGTPSYMAPELAAGRRGVLTPATDVYGLGAILYAMLTGRPPFQSASPVDTLLMLLEQDALPPRVLNPQADRDLEMIALKCLQKPADLRYPDASALAADLEAWLANEPISARSSRFSGVITRVFRETHHAPVLENWGILWMWHSLALLTLCIVTNAMQWNGVTSRYPYLWLWTAGLGAWAGIFWWLRHRAGPITFVERQIAHVWTGATASSSLLYFIEWILGLPPLTLSPVLGLLAGIVFLVKAGVLNGQFYIQAAALFLTAVLMAVMRRGEGPDWGLTLFGVVSALAFFVPGWKYYRQRRNSERVRVGSS